MAGRRYSSGFDPLTGEIRTIFGSPVQVAPGLVAPESPRPPAWVEEVREARPIMYGVVGSSLPRPQYVLRNSADVQNAQRAAATPEAVKAMESGASAVFDVRGASDLGRASRRVVNSITGLSGNKASSDDYVQVLGALATGRIIGSAAGRRTGPKVERSPAPPRSAESWSTLEGAVDAARKRVAELNSDFVSARSRVESVRAAHGGLQPPELNLKLGTGKRVGPKTRKVVSGQIEAQREYTRRAGELVSELGDSENAFAKAEKAVQDAVLDLDTQSKAFQDAGGVFQRDLDVLARALDTSPEAAAGPGWLRTAAGWAGRKAVAPFSVFRPSQWKEHPVKTAMVGLGDAAAGFLGYGIYQGRKTADKQLEWRASQDAAGAQSTVNRNAAGFRAISPRNVAFAFDAGDFGPFDAARSAIGAVVRDSTNPRYGSSVTNTVSLPEAEAMALALPRGGWYQYASSLFPGQDDRRFVRTAEGRYLDMSDEGAVSDYAIQKFLEDSKYREEGLMR